MSNLSQFFGCGAGGTGKLNRRIFHAQDLGQPTQNSASYTWEVPPDATEVEVHCWGGGAPGSPFGGGSGGGYVTHVYPVTSSDIFSITVGSDGGTSSVSVPTQSPTSPISATGGSGSTSEGTGSYSIAPGISTARTFTASGGEGGSSFVGAGGGGGGAGFIYGPGGDGGNGASLSPQAGGGGGGIVSPGSRGSSSGGGGGGFNISYHLSKPFSYSRIGASGMDGSVKMAGDSIFGGDNWFYLHEIKGTGGSSLGAFPGSPPSMPLADISGPGGAGGGGCGGDPAFPRAGDGGIFGGGGGTITSQQAGNGGFAAGGGSGASPVPIPGRGGSGIVIFYW